MSSDITEKGRAVFLAALMVLSVVAMTTAFAGSAAAQTAEITITSDDTAAEAVEKIETASNGSTVVIENDVDISISESIDVDNSSVVIRGEDENLDNGPVIQMDNLGTGDEGFSIRAEDVEISNIQIVDDASSGVAWNIRSTENGTVVDNVAIERDETNTSLSGLANPAINFIDVSDATVTNSNLTNGAINVRLSDSGEATIQGNKFTMPDGFPNAFFITGESFDPLSENVDVTIENNGEIAIADRTESDYIRGFTTISGAFNAPQTGDPVGEDGTVSVAPGTYEESISIATNNVQLVGPNADVTATGDADKRQEEATIAAPSGERAIDITGNGVDISGFEIEANGSDAIFVQGQEGDLSGTVTITNNTIQSDDDAVSNGVGISADGNPGGPENAVVRGNDIDSKTAAVNVYAGAEHGTVKIHNNELSGNPGGIRDVNELKFTDNVINDLEGGSVDLEAIDGGKIARNNFEEFDDAAISVNVYNSDAKTEVNVDIYENSFSDSGTAIDAEAATDDSDIDATLNWWGEDGPQPSQISGNVVYDPYLTAPPEDLEVEDPMKTQQFGHEIVIPADGEPYTIGFPGPVDGNAGDVFGEVLDDEGTMVLSYDAADEEWVPVDGDDSIGAMDAFVVKGNETSEDYRIRFSYDERPDGQEAYTTADLEPGWNLVAPTQIGHAVATDSDSVPSDGQAFKTVDGDIVSAKQLLEGGDRQPSDGVSDETLERELESEFGGPETAVVTSPYEGYWVASDDAELVSEVPAGTSVETEQSGVTPTEGIFEPILFGPYQTPGFAID